MSEENSFLIFSGTKSRYLAEKICASLGCPLGKLVVTQFSDGEFSVSYEETVRGREHQQEPSMLLFPTLAGLDKTVKTSRVLALVLSLSPTCCVLLVSIV